jgi:hypothetical protein
LICLVNFLSSIALPEQNAAMKISLKDLKMNHPKSGAKRLEELQSFRKRLAK